MAKTTEEITVTMLAEQIGELGQQIADQELAVEQIKRVAKIHKEREKTSKQALLARLQDLPTQLEIPGMEQSFQPVRMAELSIGVCVLDDGLCEQLEKFGIVTIQQIAALYTSPAGWSNFNLEEHEIEEIMDYFRVFSRIFDPNA